MLDQLVIMPTKTIVDSCLIVDTLIPTLKPIVTHCPIVDDHPLEMEVTIHNLATIPKLLLVLICIHLCVVIRHMIPTGSPDS